MGRSKKLGSDMLGGVSLVRGSGEFDEAWYLERNLDVAAAGMDPIAHYLEFGADEGRNPSPLFNTHGYLTRYPEVAAARLNPLVHYVLYGRNEGRSRGEPFDEDFYLDAYSDVREAVATGAFKSGYDQWTRHGQGEGRAPTRPPTFRFSSLPKVSIAMPVLNGGHYFQLALASALAQLYEDIEIIVVDDGSTDGGEAEAIARQFESPKIKYIRQDNKGVAGALNTAIVNMSGDFFSWLSHDDLFLPEKTSAQVEFYQRLGREDAIVFSNYDIIDGDGNLVSEINLDCERIRRNPLLPLHHAYINGCTVFMPLPVLRKFGQFDEDLRYTQDYDMWNRIIGQHEFFLLPRRLVKCRTHPRQGSRNPEAAIEGDRLWARILDSRSETQRVQLFGSTWRYFDCMGKFLEQTPYKRAAMYARERARRATAETLVSVIIPVMDEVEPVVAAAKSVLDQTHAKLELIVVDGGAASTAVAIGDLQRSDPRLRCVSLSVGGPGAAHNLGLKLAAGDYIAFLGPRDRFAPNKVALQLAAMQKNGSLFSHTSYDVIFPEGRSGVGPVSSGRFRGVAYPKIIADCPIATSTVILHRSLVDAAFRFVTESHPAEEVMLWISLARDHELLGVDDPLSVVDWSTKSAMIDLGKSVRATARLLDEITNDPFHSRHFGEIAALRRIHQQLVERAAHQNPAVGGAPLNEALISPAFQQ